MLSTRTTVRCDLLLPIRDNGGRDFGSEDFGAFERFLVGLAGGFTRRGEVDGAWRSPDTGELMADRSKSYSVVLDAERALEQVAKIDTYIKHAFRQQASYVELIPIRATDF